VPNFEFSHQRIDRVARRVIREIANEVVAHIYAKPVISIKTRSERTTNAKPVNHSAK